MLRGQGEQAVSEGSKLVARGASWGLPKAPGRFQGPRDAQGEGSKLGARGVSWEHWEQAGDFLKPHGFSRDPWIFQGPRDAQGVRGSKF